MVIGSVIWVLVRLYCYRFGYISYCFGYMVNVLGIRLLVWLYVYCFGYIVICFGYIVIGVVLW